MFALLLLGCALSEYLWTISRTVAGVVLAFALFGVTSYISLTLAAALYYGCPYQKPPSILAQTIISYLKCSDVAVARSLRSLGSFPSIQDLRRILRRLSSGVRRALESYGRIPTVAEEAEHIPLAAIPEPPTRIFENLSIDADARCISWVLESSTVRCRRDLVS